MSQQTRPSHGNAGVEQQDDDYARRTSGACNVTVGQVAGGTPVDSEGGEYLGVFPRISAVNVGRDNRAIVEAAEDRPGESVHGCSDGRPNQPDPFVRAPDAAIAAEVAE